MTLKKDLSLFSEKGPNPYEKYFLLENPFPGYGEIESDVCTDQEILKKQFVSILQNFSTEAKRLCINGGNGAGKTNILRYFERLTDEARGSKRIGNFQPIYVSTPEESYFYIHAQIIDKLTGLFLNDLIRTLQSNPGLTDSLSIKLKATNELLRMISAIAQPFTMPLFSEEERQKDSLIRWLKGQKLTTVDKKLLTYGGIPPLDITSSSLAIQYLYGLLDILKELRMCDGIVLLFDEFEEIFGGLTRSRQSRYAQDLRHLFDVLKESVFFVIATIPEPKDLAQYPAIDRRLGKPIELRPIDSSELAINYVSDYLNNGRDGYEAYLKENKKQPECARPDGLKPLTQKDVEKEYYLLKEDFGKSGLNVLPGHFLPKMRERIEQKIGNSN